MCKLGKRGSYYSLGEMLSGYSRHLGGLWKRRGEGDASTKEKGGIYHITFMKGKQGGCELMGGGKKKKGDRNKRNALYSARG